LKKISCVFLLAVLFVFLTRFNYVKTEKEIDEQKVEKRNIEKSVLYENNYDYGNDVVLYGNYLYFYDLNDAENSEFDWALYSLNKNYGKKDDVWGQL